MTGVAFTADGAKLVTGSQDKTFRVFNLADQKQIASVETPAPVNAVALVAEGKQVATGGEDNIIRLWDLPAAQPAEAAKPVKEMTGHGGPVTSLVALAPTERSSSPAARTAPSACGMWLPAMRSRT